MTKFLHDDDADDDNISIFSSKTAELENFWHVKSNQPNETIFCIVGL